MSRKTTAFRKGTLINVLDKNTGRLARGCPVKVTDVFIDERKQLRLINGTDCDGNKRTFTVNDWRFELNLPQRARIKKQN